MGNKKESVPVDISEDEIVAESRAALLTLARMRAPAGTDAKDKIALRTVRMNCYKILLATSPKAKGTSLGSIMDTPEMKRELRKPPSQLREEIVALAAKMEAKDAKKAD